MSVNWRHILAIPVPTVLTKMAASTAHVVKALRVMDSTAQVKLTDELLTCSIAREFMDQDHDAVVAVTTESFSFVMQTSMSVRVMTPTDVMRMHSALTQWGVIPAPVILATLKMELPVQVSY